MFSMAQGFNVQDRNAAIGLGQAHTHTFHAEGLQPVLNFLESRLGLQYVCNCMQLL